MALIIRVIFGLIGAGLAFWSFRANAHFWEVTFAADAVAQQFYVAISLAAGAIKYGAVIYVETFRLAWRREKALAAFFALALTYDLISGVGYASLTRATVGDENEANATRAAAIARQISEAEAKRTGIATARTVGRIEAELAPKAPDDCEGRKARTDRCLEAATLKAELADAKTRDDANTELRRLRAELEGLPPSKTSDPQAAAVASALNAVTAPLGLSVSLDGAKYLLALLLVLFVELGPVKCVRLAFAHHDTRAADPEFASPAQSRRRAPAAAPPVPNRPPLQVVGGTQHAPRSAPKRDPLLAILEAAARDPAAAPAWLKMQPDGWLYFAQIDLSVALGVSKPTAGRRLAKLAREGALELRATNQGSAIKLLYFTNSTGNAGRAP